ncbi:hypothetical protein AMK59_4449 [Oryctes borbonicus]|uniref:Uncharacterized protein n=1 Tax=Oryctes borbonicus TaxID=1629725 RepID=A0A0T6B593_9SCAR|nr:hypothetical protein AMK59_4449 [Oryctes borbonicus]
MPILFAGLEGTLIILNAMLYDKNKFTKEQLSSFYALAIMRFLNLCAANSDQQGTFFRIAKERNLPDWLVSIRHDLAHSQKCSSFFMLQKGIEYCFEWLKHEYWELQDREIIDFTISEAVTESIEENIHLYCEYVNSKISGEKLSSSVISMLKNLNSSKYLTPKEVLEKILQGNKLAIEKAVDVIVENNYFLAGITDDTEKIPNSHISEWESLIQYIQNHDMLMKLIKKLNCTCADSEDFSAQRLYSFWMKEILTGLITKTNEYQHSKFVCNDQTIKLQQPNESFLTQLKEFVDEALENPHPYLKNYSSW